MYKELEKIILLIKITIINILYVLYEEKRQTDSQASKSLIQIAIKMIKSSDNQMYFYSYFLSFLLLFSLFFIYCVDRVFRYIFLVIFYVIFLKWVDEWVKERMTGKNIKIKIYYLHKGTKEIKYKVIRILTVFCYFFFIQSMSIQSILIGMGVL